MRVYRELTDRVSTRFNIIILILSAIHYSSDTVTFRSGRAVVARGDWPRCRRCCSRRKQLEEEERDEEKKRVRRRSYVSSTLAPSLSSKTSRPLRNTIHKHQAFRFVKIEKEHTNPKSLPLAREVTTRPLHTHTL